MTDTAGPFDGTPWAEGQWARHASAWAPSGVYGSPAASTTTGDLPLSVSALTVGLGAGRAWVRGFGFERSGAAVMQTVTPNTHASFNRCDRIVLRRNLATHTLTPVLLTGTPSGTPTPPALTQSETGSWDLPCFSFLVPPASGTAITGLVDERGWVDSADGSLAFATTTARDANFPSPQQGNQCTVAGVPQVYDTAWRYVAAQPSWSKTFQRGGGASDDYTGTGSLLGGTWVGAPAGDYLIHSTIVVQSTINVAGTLIVTAGGATLTTPTHRADVPSAFAATITNTHALDNWAGGDLAVALSHAVSSTVTVYNPSCKLVVEYLGPRR